ncbi:naDH dehydrogenase (NDH2-II) [Cardiosporidium cionae]|uniref:NADH:ubiquinone reductase (non-electrogenic) n=1 Tax=Cardiosporidium cionae TaxID=476202 RepID=A0ABQ7J8K5_9APIC|nr:naDH dehydrogenase (NDH2-II) [Cardiosporidium cionae]|eukprot:KAF8819985.1 naDH dehydrogenase (NDH2-II) [Cardiosporidium cionae]
MSHLHGDILKFLPSLQSKIDVASSYWSNLWTGDERNLHNKEELTFKKFEYSMAALSSSPISQKIEPFPFSAGTWYRQDAYNKWVNLQIRFGKDISKAQRKRIVIVGAGWASIAFLSHIDVSKYDVKIVSPRNYFAFTPLLPSACNGTLSPEACMVPIKHFTKRGGKKVMEYYEARASSLDVEHSKIHCGGPTGVEVAAELSDFLREDCKKAFPALLPFIQVTIIEMLPRLLPVFSEKAKQKGNRVLRVDPHLLTHGTKNVYTLGDCASITPSKLENLADVLFAEAIHHPSKAGSDFLSKKTTKGLHLEFPQLKENKWDFKKKPRRNNMTLDEFKAYLKEIDNAYMSPAPTAQNAKKQGTYLATVFNSYLFDDEKLHVPIYEETWDGSMAYVGKNRAILDLPFTSVCGGFYSGFLWKLVYWKMVYSMEAKLRCVEDWFKSSIFGRNLGRERAVK